MLTFNLKKQWFEKIKSGEKTIEYRETGNYWFSRIIHAIPEWKNTYLLEHIHVPCVFRCGYSKVGELKAIIIKLEVINGKNTDLHIDKDVYAIHFELIEEK